MSIRLRLTLWYGAVLAGALLLTGVALVVAFDRAVAAQTDADLAARAETAVVKLAGGNGQQGGHVDEEAGVPDALVLFVDARGVVTSSNVPGAQAEAALVAAATRAGTATYDTTTIAGKPVRIHVVPVTSGGRRIGTVVVGRSIDALEAARRQLVTALLLLAPAALVLASGGGYVLARRALRPVDELRRRAEEIVRLDDLDRRLAPEARDDELGRLARTLDDMLARIAHAAAQERRFIADASHELRTPLSALLGDTSLTLSRPRTADQYRGAVERAQREAARLGSIVDALLTISRAEAGALARGAPTTDLAEVAALAVERHTERARERGVRLRLRAAPGTVARADPDALARVLDNLIENALRYGAGGGEVRVAAAADDGRVRLVVEDDGAGFAPDLLPRAFERFRRGSAARHDGAGLGLAIVAAVAQAYGGTATAENTSPCGARVSVVLPNAERRES